MLALPEKGMARSLSHHNIDRSKLCDWIEASVIFDDNELSVPDVIDALVDNEVYETQDFASEIVESAWGVLRTRFEYLQAPLGITVSRNRITRTLAWTTFPAYGFCMGLACADLYPKWAKSWETPASVQGSYFEELAAESFAKTLAGWKVQRVGWSPKNPKKLRDTISGIIADLGEIEGAELDIHVNQSANELGLDLLAYHSYGDTHASIPVFLIQCASGRDWVKKRQTPDLTIWNKVVSFNSRPVRGFAMPFAFAERDEFRKQTAAVDGIFADRNRILAAFPRNAGSVSAQLNQKLLAWTKAQVKNLPKDTH